MRTLEDADRMRMHMAQAVLNNAVADLAIVNMRGEPDDRYRVARDSAWDAWVALWEELYAKLKEGDE